MSFPASTLVPGSARASAVVLDEPLSLWGGLRPETGEIVDHRHPQRGVAVSGRILVMPSGRGSSSSSSVLVEAVRAGSAPAGIVLAEADAILALGAIVADELYGARLPIVVAPPDVYGRARDGDALTITAEPDGARIEIEEGGRS